MALRHVKIGESDLIKPYSICKTLWSLRRKMKQAADTYLRRWKGGKQKRPPRCPLYKAWLAQYVRGSSNNTLSSQSITEILPAGCVGLGWLLFEHFAGRGHLWGDRQTLVFASHAGLIWSHSSPFVWFPKSACSSAMECYGQAPDQHDPRLCTLHLSRSAIKAPRVNSLHHSHLVSCIPTLSYASSWFPFVTLWPSHACIHIDFHCYSMLTWARHYRNATINHPDTKLIACEECNA